MWKRGKGSLMIMGAIREPMVVCYHVSHSNLVVDVLLRYPFGDRA